MEPHVAPFMRQRGPQAVFVAGVLGQPLGDPYQRFVSRGKFGKPLDHPLVRREIGIQIERGTGLLDQHGEVIGGDGELYVPMAVSEEGGDEMLTFLIQLVGVIVRALRKPAGAISRPLHALPHFLPLRNRRNACSTTSGWARPIARTSCAILPAASMR